MALTTILVVSDMNASKKFYLDVLGCELYREYAGTSAVMQFLGCWILLVLGGGPTPDKPTITFTAPGSDDISHSFTIRVENCAESYEVLKSRGAVFLTPPRESDAGGEIRGFFRDPDGHLFEISQVSK